MIHNTKLANFLGHLSIQILEINMKEQFNLWKSKDFLLKPLLGNTLYSFSLIKISRMIYEENSTYHQYAGDIFLLVKLPILAFVKFITSSAIYVLFSPVWTLLAL